MKNYLLLFIALLTICSTSFSQDYPDSKGREFYISFLPSPLHYSGNRDSLYIYISAEEPTTGHIEYRDSSGQSFRKDFSISNVSEIFTYSLPYTSFILPTTMEETVVKPYFRIVADKEVTVYGLSSNQASSDAFLALPVDVLSNNYLVMSYYNNYDRKCPSSFAVTATTDNTTVMINPSAETKRNSTRKQTIFLNRGESYYVEANVLIDQLNIDLTGTEIQSDKPVAVFGGHTCAAVATDQKDYGSGDVLIEQMVPVSSWGKNAFITPFVQTTNVDTANFDVYRVMAADNNTKVTINGTETIYLNKGRFFQRNITEAVCIEADKPILTAQYKKSSIIKSQHYGTIGDPFMTLIPSKEQFLASYRIMAMETYNGFGKAFTEHFITVIADSSSRRTLTLDGKILPSSDYYPIASTDHVYARVNTKIGPHYLECNKPFGVLSYGYGSINSYGYTGGMKLSRPDMPPVVTVTDSCFSVTGTVTDSSGLESGLSDITAPSVNIENAIVSINSFQKDDKAAAFSAKLIDRYKDGKFTIVATDSAGNVASKEIGIPGFTVSHPYTYTADTIPVYSPKLTIGTKYCFRIPIYNYGAYEQTVQALSVGNPAITINHATPHKLGVKETDSVELCILIANNDPIDDILYLTGPCGTRPIAKISAGKTDCDETMFVYDDFDNDPFIEYNASAKRAAKNIRLTPSKPNTKGSCWRTLKMPVRKGFVTEFAFSVSDGFNHTSAENSLPGADGLAFVIQNEGLGVVGNYGAGIGYDGIGNSVAVEFDLFHNDSTQLFDYYDPDGNHVAVQSLGTQPNSSAHTKQATLGITDTLTTIKPNGRPYYARIEYNLLPNVLRVYLNNTRVFTTPVLEVKNFKLENYVSLERDEFAYVGFTAATANSFEIHEILNWYFCPKPTDGIQTGAEDQIDNGTGLLIYPNPAGDYLNVNLHGNSGEIAIYSLLGEEVKRLGADGNTRVDISELPRGCYIVRINYNNGQSLAGSFIINR